MGSAQIQQVPVATTPVQAWVGIPTSEDQITYWNQDTNNSVFLGFQQTIAANGLNTIPVPPNASFQLPANRNVFVIGASSGIKPLVVIPSSGNMFRSLTSGLGSLAIPSVRSPNFIHNVSGWSVNQDGTAEFQNAIIRGLLSASNVSFNNGYLSNGDGTFTNQPGLFIYSAAPAAGNLVFAATMANGTDIFNNNFLNGDWNYFGTVAIGRFGQTAIAVATSGGNPNAVWTTGIRLDEDAVNNALVLNGNGAVPALEIAEPGGTSSLSLDSNGMLTNTAWRDGNVYKLGICDVHLASNATAITLASFTSILTQQLAAGVNYRFSAKVFFQGNAAGGQAVLSMSHGNGATNTLCGARALFGPSGGGQGGLTFVTHAATFPGDQTDPIVLTNGGLGVWEIDGYTNCTGTGSLIISGAQVGGGNWTPLSGSFFDIWPV